jgi:hypothetical protein
MGNRDKLRETSLSQLLQIVSYKIVTTKYGLKLNEKAIASSRSEIHELRVQKLEARG